MNPNNFEKLDTNLAENKEISSERNKKINKFASRFLSKEIFDLHRSDVVFLLEECEGEFDEVIPDLEKVLIFNAVELLLDKPYLQIASDQITHLATVFWSFKNLQAVLSPYPEFKIIFTYMAELCGFIYGQRKKEVDIAIQFYEYIGSIDEIKKLENKNFQDEFDFNDDSAEWKNALSEFINKVKPYLITKEQRDDLFEEIKTKFREKLAELK